MHTQFQRVILYKKMVLNNSSKNSTPPSKYKSEEGCPKIKWLNLPLVDRHPVHPSGY